LDLVLIQRHVIGIMDLDSPYKLIAADIDNSGSITALDLIQLRKLILGIYEEFPNNNSWRLVDRSHQFLDPANPFAFEFPEDYEIPVLTKDMKVDFVGVKIGDVNNTVKANALEVEIESRSTEAEILNIPNEKLMAGQTVEIPFSADLNQIEGLQFGLNIDLEKAEFKGFVPVAKDMTAHNISLLQKSKGKIKFSWNSNQDHETDELFYLVFNVKKDCQVSEVLSFEKTLKPEAYKQGSELDLNISFGNEKADADQIILYQNIPNPWSERTDIKFYLPHQDQVILNLFDMNGRKILEKNINGLQGENLLSLDKNDLKHTGVLYYQLISKDVQLTKKMILLD